VNPTADPKPGESPLEAAAGAARPHEVNAFGVLGNETRLAILLALWEAYEPHASDNMLSFTELRERVGIRQGGQFDYHLDKLVGHFVRKTDDGYELRQAGRRVIYAVLSEAVTNAPVMERTRINHPCPYCGASIEVRYNEGHVEKYCTDCAGMTARDDPDQRGYLGCLVLPPAGLQGRSTEEAFRAAWVWSRLSVLAVANGICPHCSATLERWVDACEDHDPGDGLCASCDRRHAVAFHFDCPNCIYNRHGTAEVGLAAHSDLLAFLTARGLNPVSPTEMAAVDRLLNDSTERVRSTEPFEAEVTFTAGDESLALTVDDDLNVVDVAVREVGEPR
jgi:hypothetical protein